MTVLKLLSAGILSITLSACTTHEMSASDADALYQQRYALYSSGKMESYYDPMAPVAGATNALPLPVADAAQRTIDPTALAQARDYAARNNSSAYLVWRNGSIEDAAYFNDTTRETPVNAMSLAKPLGVIAIGRAIALGKIKSLDQSAADFIPQWKGTPKEKITLRFILQMRSGLEPQSFTAGIDTPMTRGYLHPFHDKYLAQEYRLVEEPGAKFGYSNANGELVALIIAKATGQPYERFVSQEVLRPLGALGGKIWLDRPGGTAHSGCCIYLPPETWLRLGILVLQKGEWNGKRLLPEGYVRDMITPSQTNPYAGMGIYVAGTYTNRRGFGGPNSPGGVLHGAPYLADDLTLFDGNADQVVYIVPSANLVALRTGKAPPKTPEWDNAVIPNLLLNGIDWHGNPPAPQPHQ